jgi:hypothetical protein
MAAPKFPNLDRYFQGVLTASRFQALRRQENWLFAGGVAVGLILFSFKLDALAWIAIGLGIVGALTLGARRARVKSPLDLLGRNVAGHIDVTMARMYRAGRLGNTIGPEALALLELCAGHANQISARIAERRDRDGSLMDLEPVAVDLEAATGGGIRCAMLCFRRALYYDLPVQHTSLERARQIEAQLSTLCIEAELLFGGDMRQVIQISNTIDQLKALRELEG